MENQPIPKTMLQAVQQFSDPQVAHDFFVQIRWPNGVACPRMGCGSASVAYLAKYRRWYCNDCKRQFTAKVGTIFEDSPIPFTKWLPAIWLLASNRNGVSSCELARALGTTQKTAWFMLHRIRLAMGQESFGRLNGEVEADETFVGGKLRHKRRTHYHVPSGMKAVGSVGKTPVLGIVERSNDERQGQARAFVVPSVRKGTLVPKILENVDSAAKMFTDSLMSYKHLDRYFAAHEVVNHAFEYVRGNAHVNNVECFWSVLKRTLGGTYVHVLPEHLQAYLNEHIFRFSERTNQDGPRFAKAVKMVDGKRLTYKALTDK
ncbi:IS1595 family transposase [bacterium]|nr:MAG: IS1595 family transposase [bacterium]